MNKNFLIIGGFSIVCLLVALFSFLFFRDDYRGGGAGQPSDERFSQTSDQAVSELFVVSTDLQEKITQDIDEFVAFLQNQEIQERFRTINQTALSFDVEATSPPVDREDLVSHSQPTLLDDYISRQLEIFQEYHPQNGFMEIFVTDYRGMRIGQTSSSEERYYGDVQWWLSAKEGLSFENIRQDPMTRAFSLNVSFPLEDSSGAFIGVGHVLIDVISIRGR